MISETERGPLWEYMLFAAEFERGLKNYHGARRDLTMGVSRPSGVTVADMLSALQGINSAMEVVPQGLPA